MTCIINPANIVIQIYVFSRNTNGCMDGRARILFIVYCVMGERYSISHTIIIIYGGMKIYTQSNIRFSKQFSI